MSQWDSELACLGSNLDFATPIHTLSCAGHIIFPCLSFLNQKMASQARSKKSVNLPLVILELGGGGGEGGQSAPSRAAGTEWTQTPLRFSKRLLNEGIWEPSTGHPTAIPRENTRILDKEHER